MTTHGVIVGGDLVNMITHVFLQILSLLRLAQGIPDNFLLTPAQTILGCLFEGVLSWYYLATKAGPEKILFKKNLFIIPTNSNAVFLGQNLYSLVFPRYGHDFDFRAFKSRRSNAPEMTSFSETASDLQNFRYLEISILIKKCVSSSAKFCWSQRQLHTSGEK